MSSSYKFISSLSYLSIVFAPFLVPFMIYLFNDHLEVKKHARKAITTHLIPIIALALLSILFFESGQLLNVLSISYIVLFGGTAIVLIIWNVVRGIHVLLEK
ncbi:hypothetical protein [Pseudalkalibacillus sp. SCS-8]|uniref:hypothetical protein n=1 Tax=Pseudalkalibacillus nanhaiensis TaxID=3115291 RepID=UPI0032DA65F6